MKRIGKQWPLVIVLSFMLMATSSALAEALSVSSARIGGLELKGAKDVLLTRDDLTIRGEVLIEGEATAYKGSVEKVEVSLDRGRTWQEAVGRHRWRYRFVPTPRYPYNLTVRVTDSTGATSVPFVDFGLVRLTYLPMTITDLVQQKTQELALAYMSRDLERYMGLISRNYVNYPRGWVRLRKAIEYDFKSLNNVILRFTVNQVFNMDGHVLADLHWRLTYAGLTEPKEGDMTIRFDRADQMKVLLQKGELYFSEAPIGYDARISIVPDWVSSITIIVTDRDKAGAGRVSAYVRIDDPPFNGTMTLLENPSRSGRFVGSRPFTFTMGVSCSVTYIDEITSDWRRNVRRSRTYTVP